MKYTCLSPFPSRSHKRVVRQVREHRVCSLLRAQKATVSPPLSQSAKVTGTVSAWQLLTSWPIWWTSWPTKWRHWRIEWGGWRMTARPIVIIIIIIIKAIEATMMATKVVVAAAVTVGSLSLALLSVFKRQTFFIHISTYPFWGFLRLWWAFACVGVCVCPFFNQPLPYLFWSFLFLLLFLTMPN